MRLCVSDAQSCAERQSAVRGREFVGIVALAAGGSARIVLVVEGGDTGELLLTVSVGRSAEKIYEPDRRVNQPPEPVIFFLLARVAAFGNPDRVAPMAADRRPRSLRAAVRMAVSVTADAVAADGGDSGNG